MSTLIVAVRVLFNCKRLVLIFSHEYPISNNKVCNNTNSLVVIALATYSVLIDESATICCFLLYQNNILPFSLNKYLEVECQVLISLVQFASH